MGELWDQLPTLVAGAERPQAPSSFGALVERQARGGGGPGSAAPPPRPLCHCPACSHLPWVAARRPPPAPPSLGASAKEHADDGGNRGREAACQAYSWGWGRTPAPHPEKRPQWAWQSRHSSHGFLALLCSSLRERVTSDSSRVDATVPRRLSLDGTPPTPREACPMLGCPQHGGSGQGAPLVSTVCVGVAGTPSPPFRPSLGPCS